MSRFNTVLIANRGEIACRIISSAQSLGYRTVAVYSDADASAPHVLMADDAVHIGNSPVQESYLVGQKIIEAAVSSGAQAIHPGYGFLSENADFAEACDGAGLVFIGPSAEAIRVMGNKAEAKRHMLAAQVPCVPGYQGEQQDDAALLSASEEIGVPIMVKAAAGGGGRGMRLVDDLAKLEKGIQLARSEAKNAFGSDELILEKAIIEPRHVEVQVFADKAGNTVHLGERDCSVQRRHQKVVEEAPCPIMTPDLREKMGTAAVAAARSINYEGAGTVEFLLDADGKFYFLEMNTRLQVEHPVTELITGLDLVALQLQVAQGDDLGFSQDDVALRGHAIEVRLYSEDPSTGFLPTSGNIDLWQPASGEGIRIDSGILSGQEISPFYDPMVAKVIASGPDRETARKRLIEALQRTVLYGVKNNKSFLVECLKKPSFIDGAATTAFIEQEFTEADLSEFVPSFEQAAMAAVIEQLLAYRTHNSQSVGVSSILRNWSSMGALVSRSHYIFDQADYDLNITAIGDNRYLVSDEQQSVSLEAASMADDCARILVNGKRSDLHFAKTQGVGLYVSFGQFSACFINQLQRVGISDETTGGGQIVAPMHGLVMELKVGVGDQVQKGQSLLRIEAMKMQHELCAQVDGEVIAIHVKSDQQVSSDDLLIELETN